MNSKKGNNKENMLNFTDIVKSERPKSFDADAKLSDYIDWEIIIENIEIIETQSLGNAIIITANVGNEIKRLLTFSTIIYKQIMDYNLMEKVKAGAKIKAYICKKKRYLMLC